MSVRLAHRAASLTRPAQRSDDAFSALFGAVRGTGAARRRQLTGLGEDEERLLYEFATGRCAHARTGRFVLFGALIGGEWRASLCHVTEPGHSAVFAARQGPAVIIRDDIFTELAAELRAVCDDAGAFSSPCGWGPVNAVHFLVRAWN